jgi:uncharacterized OB-fold protein
METPVAERRSLPVPDRDSAPYWAALAEGRLELQHCLDCSRWTWPARAICSGCHGENLRWEAVQGTGAVHSWVVTHQIYAPEFVELVPYTVVLVRIDEQDDILIPGRLVSDVEETQRSAGRTPGSTERSQPDTLVHQGLKVRAAPERVTDDVGQLHWRADT